MTAPWAVCLDDHADVVNWMKGRTGHLCTGYAMLGGAFNTGLMEGGRAFADETDRLVDEIRGHLEAAETYWVSSDMGSLIQHAAPDPKLLGQKLRQEDLPSKSGFLVFDSQVVFGSASIKALTWYRKDDQVIFWCWETKELARRRDGQPLVGDGSFDDEIFKGTHYIPINQWPWTIGAALEEVGEINTEWCETEEEMEQERLESIQERQECLAIVYCTMLMLGQKIARTEDGRVPRAAAKRAARVGLPNDTVRCITLRREQILGKSGEPDTGQAINYSHRFMVRGHWKPQWYPSLQDHRIIYIAPYIKGPDDKPLIIRDTVYALKR